MLAFSPTNAWIHALAGVGTPPPIPPLSPDRSPAGDVGEQPTRPPQPEPNAPSIDDPASPGDNAPVNDPSSPVPASVRRMLH